MTWFRCGGGGSGIPAALKNRMNAVLNKKFGTAVDYPANGWPDDVNLLGMLEEKTQASASVCAFDDGADDVPSSSVKVTIPASLSGVSSVTETQTGRNVRQNITDYSSVNPVFFQYRNYYAGQATGYPKLEGTFKAGTYTLSFDTNASITESKVGVWAKKKNDQNWYNLSANGDLVTPTSSGYSFCSVSSGHVTGTFTINEECDALGFGYYQYGTSIPYTNLMLEIGSTAHAYEPYQTPTVYTASLGRTIYGGDVDIVDGVGESKYAKYIVTGQETGEFLAGTNNNGNRIGLNGFELAQKPLYTGGVSNIGENKACLNSGTWTIGSWCIYTNNRLYFVVPNEYTTFATALQYLVDNDATFVFPLATPTDFTFTGQEVPTRLGYNAFWSDSGDTEVTYRSSGTITPVPVVPTLITKTITDNGTYDAEDDDADGYSSVTVNVSGVPSGDHDDPFGVMTDYTRFNISNLYSAYYIGNGELKKEVVFQLASGSGYEGFCISLEDLNLTDGTQYTLSFVLDVPNTATFSGSYPWGIKYSSTRVPTSGSAGSNTFNITPTVNFVEQTGTQNVSITFTAGSSNYLVVLLARVAGSVTAWLKMQDINISEVNP